MGPSCGARAGKVASTCPGGEQGEGDSRSPLDCRQPHAGTPTLKTCIASPVGSDSLMLQVVRQRRGDRGEGFTLVELMVVVLIIAILLAIAIPTFLGARERAQDRAAQSNLRNAYTAAKAIFTDNENYLCVNASELN